MELADVTDSKSVGSNTVRVRPPPPAPEKHLPVSGRRFLVLAVEIQRNATQAGFGNAVRRLQELPQVMRMPNGICRNCKTLTAAPFRTEPVSGRRFLVSVVEIRRNAMQQVLEMPNGVCRNCRRLCECRMAFAETAKPLPPPLFRTEPVLRVL